MHCEGSLISASSARASAPSRSAPPARRTASPRPSRRCPWRRPVGGGARLRRGGGRRESQGAERRRRGGRKAAARTEASTKRTTLCWKKSARARGADPSGILHMRKTYLRFSLFACAAPAGLTQGRRKDGRVARRRDDLGAISSSAAGHAERRQLLQVGRARRAEQAGQRRAHLGWCVRAFSRLCARRPKYVCNFGKNCSGASVPRSSNDSIRPLPPRAPRRPSARAPLRNVAPAAPR